MEVHHVISIILQAKAKAPIKIMKQLHAVTRSLAIHSSETKHLVLTRLLLKKYREVGQYRDHVTVFITVIRGINRSWRKRLLIHKKVKYLLK